MDAIEREQEIQIEYENFYIAYNRTRDIWYARHWDEDIFGDDIIIVKENLPINLFDEFELTEKEFLILQKETTIMMNNEEKS